MFPMRIRVWHWLNAIAIFGVALTVIIKELFMDKQDMAKTIVSKLGEINATITPEQAVVVAKAIRAPLWDWHIYLGIVVGVLFLYRIILMLKKVKIDDGRADAKMKAVRLSHTAMIFVIGIAVLTGLLAFYGANIGLDKALRGDIKEIHENLSWVIMAFIPLHILGVFISDNTDYKGIVSKIISG